MIGCTAPISGVCGPMMPTTWLTLISFCSAVTASIGSPSLSPLEIWIFFPRMPPLSLISLMATWQPSLNAWPKLTLLPVKPARSPRTTGPLSVLLGPPPEPPLPLPR